MRCNKVPDTNVPYYFKDIHLQNKSSLTYYSPDSPGPYYVDQYDIELKGYKFKNYQFLLALLFAIEEINRNPHLLPNITLGFDFYNVRFTEKSILEGPLTWLTMLPYAVPNYSCDNKNKSPAALTGTSWSTSAHIGTLLQLYKIPQLTFGPFDSILNNQGQFNYVYQMAPKDTFLSLAIVSLMLHFSWSWVGLIIPDDHRGTQILSDLREVMERNSICIASVQMIPGIWNSFSNALWKSLEKVMESSANVMIICGDIVSLQGLMRHIAQLLVTWKVWVLNSQWDVDTHSDYFMVESLHGSFIFSHHHEEMVEFTNFIRTVNPYKYPEDNYLPKFWFLFFKCSLSEFNCQLLENCQANASLELLPKYIFDPVMSEESYNIYNAVYAVAYSLHEMNLQQIQIQRYANGEKMVVFPWEVNAKSQAVTPVLPFLKNTLLKHHMRGHTDMDGRKNLDSEYDILNFWNFPKGLGLKVKVGNFSPNAPHGQQFSLSEKMIQWPTMFTNIWFFRDMVSLHSPDCPGTHSVDQAGLQTQKSTCLCLPECWDYRLISEILTPFGGGSFHLR
ncbi:Vomeronasal 2, receptor 90 [Apodemus speciosus]|uniref:Vomeronasal 2, receptor 90 n=1 Tax=Apodemus speciosus TaxID=105296 RepID=A0ABQ0FMT1_APOSI